MLLKSRTRWSVVTGTVVLLTTAMVCAQNAPATKRQETKRQDAAKQNPNAQDSKRQDAKRQESKRPNVVTTKKVPGQASKGDAQIAACLVIDNNNAIALGQLAQQRSQNAEVKDFAQRIVQDHEQLVNQLQPIASAGGFDVARPASGERGSADKSGNRRNQRDEADAEGRKGRGEGKSTAAQEADAQRADNSAEGNQQGGEHGLDFVRIHQEIAAKCLQSARTMLEEKPAAKFDKCYITGQIMAHTAMVDALEVLKNHATGELTAVIDDGLKTSQAHLDEAKRLEKTLESAPQK